MNAMNFVFLPRGLTEAVLETSFDHLYRVFYSRPEVLWGLCRLMAREPQFLWRLVRSARIYLRRQVATRRYRSGRLPPQSRVAAPAEP